ncbi:Hypothetical predicted protein, partial [Mytilus galloprovincialis]
VTHVHQKPCSFCINRDHYNIVAAEENQMVAASPNSPVCPTKKKMQLCILTKSVLRDASGYKKEEVVTLHIEIRLLTWDRHTIGASKKYLRGDDTGCSYSKSRFLRVSHLIVGSIKLYPCPSIKFEFWWRHFNRSRLSKLCQIRLRKFTKMTTPKSVPTGPTPSYTMLITGLNLIVFALMKLLRGIEPGTFLIGPGEKKGYVSKLGVTFTSTRDFLFLTKYKLTRPYAYSWQPFFYLLRQKINFDTIESFFQARHTRTNIFTR